MGRRRREGGWSSCFPRKGYGVGLWKTLQKRSHLISNRFSFVVGDVKRIKYWKDRWCNDTPLNVAYPSLFTLACAKDAWVGGLWSAELGGGCWNPTFVRSFNDWEMEDVESLLGLLGGRKVIEGVEDTVWWMGSKNGLFAGNSLYKALVHITLFSFPWKCI